MIPRQHSCALAISSSASPSPALSKMRTQVSFRVLALPRRRSCSREVRQVTKRRKIMTANLSKSFRIFWRILTLNTWLLVTYLAFHKSQNPDIFHRYSREYFQALSIVCSFAIIITIANLETLVKRIYAGRYSIILFFTSLLLAFVSAEIYLRIADPLGISYYEGAARYELYVKIPDPGLIFRHRPYLRITY